MSDCCESKLPEGIAICSSAFDGVSSDLDRLGYRMTPQRRAVLRAVGAQKRSFSADEILRALDADGVGVGRATVFRTLELLRRLGYVGRVSDGERWAYTACEPGHHHHLTCSGCGKVEKIDVCPAASLLDELRERTGYVIGQHSLEITGVCPACQEV